MCALNSNCVSNFCNTTSLLCDRTVAVCPTSGVDSLECGGIDISAGTGGECLYYDGYTNAAVDNCYAGDSSCYAKCSCVGDNYGADCSLTVDAFDQLRQMREQLCRSIYLTVAIQDLTADVVASRATAISNIFLDIDQITDNALSNCTVALSETVINAIVIDPAYVAGDDEISSTVIAALSAVLAKGSDLPVELQVYVNDAITAWNAAKQAMLGVGEPESCSSTSNLNVCISNVYATDLESTQFTSAQSELDAFNNVPTNVVQLNSSTTDTSSGSVFVAVVSQPSNPRGGSTNSTSCTVETTYDATSSSMTIDLVLQNQVAMTYGLYEAFNGTIVCDVQLDDLWRVLIVLVLLLVVLITPVGDLSLSHNVFCGMTLHWIMLSILCVKFWTTQHSIPLVVVRLKPQGPLLEGIDDYWIQLVEQNTLVCIACLLIQQRVLWSFHQYQLQLLIALSADGPVLEV